MIGISSKANFVLVLILIGCYILVISDINIYIGKAIKEIPSNEFKKWLQKKEMLKTNVDKVCKKYRISIVSSTKMKKDWFLHSGKGGVERNGSNLSESCLFIS